jgi:hypothetical protein
VNAERLNPLQKYPMLNALFTTAMTMAAGYLGYEKVEEMRSQDVSVEVTVEDNGDHTHPSHGHKSWQSEINKSMREHVEAYH